MQLHAPVAREQGSAAAAAVRARSTASLAARRRATAAASQAARPSKHSSMVDLDKWIEKVKRCECLAEDELKSLCEYVSVPAGCLAAAAVRA